MKEKEKRKFRTCNTATLAEYLGLSASRIYQIQDKLPFKRKKIGPLKIWDLDEVDRVLDSAVHVE